MDTRNRVISTTFILTTLFRRNRAIATTFIITTLTTITTHEPPSAQSKTTPTLYPMMCGPGVQGLGFRV